VVAAQSCCGGVGSPRGRCTIMLRPRAGSPFLTLATDHPCSPLFLPLTARKSIVTMGCGRDAVVTQEQSWRVEIGMCPGYTKDIASKDPTVRFLPLILASVCVFFLLMAALVRQVYKYHLSKVAIAQEQWAYVAGDATLSGVRACGRAVCSSVCVGGAFLLLC
jgi:hypothetical protein